MKNPAARMNERSQKTYPAKNISGPGPMITAPKTTSKNKNPKDMAMTGTGQKNTKRWAAATGTSTTSFQKVYPSPAIIPG